MARNMQPIVKRCKTLDISPAVMGYTAKTKSSTIREPRAQMRRKRSEYATQLSEKQKVKFIYGILEKQFHAYYEKAAKTPGITGENLLTMIERRLDNVVFRLGFAMTRREARQAVTHGHFTVNGRRVDIPSYLVSTGDVIEVREKSRDSVMFRRLLGEDAVFVTVPQWLEREKNTLKGKVAKLPVREDIDFPVEETLIVELYSK
ncbi:MAG: 30S ribosomal protein S4 [Oscillospiraceae bacterium]|jgi:small subunit ribosomal protein S4|nr:30S ribosomal protein S4 [Oscillospiraceae bacterium]